jgi:non-canonical purine NTP pyrophosphatase (RdgB/HAM1 family)
MEILLATGNEHKIREFQQLLARPVQPIKLELSEIQAVEVKEVIEAKAREAYRLVGKPVFVEDTGLAFAAWDGLPGALIRWFLDRVGNEGLCQMLQSYEQTAATAETCIGYFDGSDCHVFRGVVTGQIVRTPRGSGGFGWDPIFMPDGWEKTFAEMTVEKNLVSMRKVAVAQLKAFLDEQGL